MPRRPNQREKTVRRIVLALFAVVLVAPVAIYISTFGWHITTNHSRWSEMGSAFGGIYAPILSVLTLLVLLAQVELQCRINEHTFDQSFIQDARSDIHYYLGELAKEFGREFDDGSEVGAMLISTFAYARANELSSQKLTPVADALNLRNHRLLAIWTAFYGVLVALRANDHPPYTNNFEVAKQKAIMMLSYAGCAALDQYVWCVSRGRLSFGFEFATRPQSA